MAERRMFTLKIINSDDFIGMPLAAQALYFHLSMRADDDGFVNNPRMIQRITGAKNKDYDLLIEKQFIIPFDSGVIVITHWRLHNYIPKDRYKKTIHKEEKSLLNQHENGVYFLLDTECIQNVSSLDTQVRLGKVRLGKDSIIYNNRGSDNRGGMGEKEEGQTDKRFIPPTLEEVKTYCEQRGNTVDPEKFIDYYTSNGWRVGKNKMKDWRAAIRTWERSGYNRTSTKPEPVTDTFTDFMNKELERIRAEEGNGGIL